VAMTADELYALVRPATDAGGPALPEPARDGGVVAR